MLVFNALLFPTSSDKMASLDYLMCADLGAVPGINWCQAIVNDIKFKAQYLNEKISNNDKSTPNAQGCIVFLVVSCCQLFLVFLCLPFIIIFIFRSAVSYFRSAILCVGRSFYFLSAIYLLLVISYCVSHFTYFVSHSMFRAAILSHVSHLSVASAISCSANHFYFVSAFPFVSVILLFCQILYIYCQSILMTSFLFVVCIIGQLP
jgi:hypothetical protein